MSGRKTYCQIVLVILFISLVNTTNYAIVGLQTSLYGQLGSVSSGVAFLTWTVVAPFTSLIVLLLGLKASMIVTTFGMLVYAISNYYPTWYTLVPGNFIFGASSGLQLPLTSIYLSIFARQLAGKDDNKVDSYISKLQGLAVFAVYTACVTGNVVSALVLSFGQTTVTLEETRNSSTNASSLQADNPDPLSSLNSSSASPVCSNSEAEITLLPWQYPTLISFCAVLALIGTVLSLCVASVPERQSSCKSLGASSVGKELKAILLQMARACIEPKYWLVWLMKVLDGMSIGFFFGVFTVYFIVRCLQLSLVGVSVIVWALALSISSMVVGKISLWTSRTVLIAALAALQIAVLLFMLFWQREPSLAAVIVLSAALGLSVGTSSTLTSVYLGIVGRNNKETVFSLYWAFHAFGDSISFFLSSTLSLEVFLLILLCVFGVGIVLYSLAEFIFGEQLQQKLCDTSDMGVCIGSHKKGIYILEDT